MTYVENFQAPVLLLHGESDPGVPSGQAREMAAELARLGKEHKCVIYAGEGHQSTGEAAITDAARQIERFLSEHLTPPSSKLKT
jgi:dipeptidyl aminopeptidase/acylaminoacyl peptidase